MRVRSHLHLTMFSALLESSCSWSIINCVTMLSISPYLHFFLIFVVASGNLLYEIFSLLTFHFLLIGSPPFLPLHFAWFFCCYPTLKLFMTIWLDLTWPMELCVLYAGVLNSAPATGKSTWQLLPHAGSSTEDDLELSPQSTRGWCGTEVKVKFWYYALRTLHCLWT